MTVKSLLLIMLSGVLVNNYALQKFLGISPFLGFSRKNTGCVGMGLAVAVVMLLTTAVTWPVQALLEKLEASYLQTFVFVAVILALVYIIKAVIKRPFGQYFPLIVLNSAVLGLAVNNIASHLSYVESLFAALGTGLGFLLALIVFSGVQSKINELYIPKAFRGLPAAVLAAGIVSMALMAF